jgi:cytochrome b
MTNEERVKVWDIGVRLFHWTLVVLFTVAYLSGDDEDMLHIYAGYGVIALIAFRILWGVVGTRHARFADFVYGPKATMDYARSLFSPTRNPSSSSLRSPTAMRMGRKTAGKTAAMNSGKRRTRFWQT